MHRPALLLAFLCLGCLGASRHAPSSSSPHDREDWRDQPSSLAILGVNTSTWDLLGQPDWHERLRRLLPAVQEAAPASLLPHLTVCGPNSNDEVCSNEEDANMHIPKQNHPGCRAALQCHLKFLTLIGSFLAKELTQLVPSDAASTAAEAVAAAPAPAPASRDGSWKPEQPPKPQLREQTLRRLQEAVDELEVLLAPTYGLLLRRQPCFALHTTIMFLQLWGWDFPIMLGSNQLEYQPCWDAIAVLRTANYSQTVQEQSVAFLLNHGPLKARWQHHLDTFFLHSEEHSMPWTVEGNLELLPQLSTPEKTTVLWAIPTQVFQDSGYTADPLAPEWVRFEGAGFVAAGYTWYPQIVAAGEKVTLAVRMWQQHPPSGQHPWFSISFVALRTGFTSDVDTALANHWHSAFTCSWPEEFNLFYTCAQPAVLPLQGMLNGSLPHFIDQGELLLRVTVSVLANSGSHQQGSLNHLVGPLRGPPRLLSSPALRLGYLYSERGQWGQHGFPSKRLPTSTAASIETQLDATGRDDSPLEVAKAIVAASAGLLWAARSGLWRPLNHLASRKIQLEALRPAPDVAWQIPPPNQREQGHGSQAANAAVAAALVLVPVAGWWEAAWYRNRRTRRGRRLLPPPAQRQGARQQRQRDQRHTQQLRQKQQQVGQQQGQQQGQEQGQQQHRQQGQQQHRQQGQQQHRQQGQQQGRQQGQQTQQPAISSRSRPGSNSDGHAEPGVADSVAQHSGSSPLPEAPLTGGPTGEQRRLRRRKRQALQAATQQQEGQAQQDRAHELDKEQHHLLPWHDLQPDIPAAESGGVQAVAQHARALPPAAPGDLEEGASTAGPAPVVAAAAAAVVAAAAGSAGTVATAAATAATAGPSGGTAVEEVECVVCWEERRCMVLVPCGHMALCRGCADDLMAAAEPLCPLCRASVALAQRVWA